MIDASSLVKEYERQNPGWTLVVRACGHFEPQRAERSYDATEICHYCVAAYEVVAAQRRAADRA